MYQILIKLIENKKPEVANFWLFCYRNGNGPKTPPKAEYHILIFKI